MCCEQRCRFKLIPLCLDLVGAPIKRIIIVATVITFCKNNSLVRTNREILDHPYSVSLENECRISSRKIRFVFFKRFYVFKESATNFRETHIVFFAMINDQTWNRI